jgi:sugar O-acyltransferase (sialic acid O-acetyltransferase NeuD family)
MDSIVIIGASGHAKVVIDIVEKEGKYKIAGILDLFQDVGKKILGYEVLGKVEDIPRFTSENRFIGGIVAVGDNFVRAKEVAKIKKVYPGFVFANAIHPQATVARDVLLGKGSVVVAGSIINPCCSIGENCILNSNSSIDHNSTMEDFSSLAPMATIGGNVKVCKFTAIGIGATVIHKLHIGEHVVVGAGSTVLKNISAFKVAYGSPAREMRERKIGEQYL